MQEKYQESLDTYYAGLKIIPEGNGGVKSNFYGQIGDLYYQMEKMDEAYKAYDEALKYNENNAPVLNNYSYFLTLDKKDLKKAERMAAQCIKPRRSNSGRRRRRWERIPMSSNRRSPKVFILKIQKANEKNKRNDPGLPPAGYPLGFLRV